MGGFVRHASGGGRTEEKGYFSGGVAGFFNEFAFGAVDNGFVGEFFFVSNESCADFQNTGLDGAAILFDKDDLAVGGHGKDADNPGGVGPGGELPVVDFAEREVAAFVV